MSFTNDINQLVNYIKKNEHNGLFSSGYESHYNIIQSFLDKDINALTHYRLFISNMPNYNFPNINSLIEIITFVNMQTTNKHRQFCIQFWLHTFRSIEVIQLENQLHRIFLN